MGHRQCCHHRYAACHIKRKTGTKCCVAGDLLDHVGGHVDPLRVITRIPKGMEIWNLRNRLCRIIADYRTQTALQEGCNNILRADCVQLNARLFREVRHCIRDVYVTENGCDNGAWVYYNTVTGTSVPSTEPAIEFVGRSAHNEASYHPEASGSDVVPVERQPMKIGFVMEEDSHSVDYTESMRFKIPRRRPDMDDVGELLPSLIK